MTTRLLSLCLLLIIAAGCRSARPDTIAQVATIDALLAGSYDGHMSCREMLGHGDFGIVTFDKLDGEMVVLDGVVYQVKADGSVHQPSGELTTPFAAVNHFVTDQTLPLQSLPDMAALTAQIDAAVPNPNVLVALRIHGTFTSIRCRSVPAQEPPYPPLAEVVPHQGVFDYEQIAGTLVGYRLPTFVKGVNVPGYHLHFLSDDRQRGGHVLAVATGSAQAEIDICQRLLLILPDSDALQDLDLTRDRADELEKVEK